MAGRRLEDLATIGTLDAADIFYVVDDPSGTPLGRKVPWSTVVPQAQLVKAYCRIPADGVTEFGLYNVSSVTDTGTGDRTIVWDTDFANVNYSCLSSESEGAAMGSIRHESFAVGSLRLTLLDTADAVLEDHGTSTIAIGDQ